MVLRAQQYAYPLVRELAAAQYLYVTRGNYQALIGRQRRAKRAAHYRRRLKIAQETAVKPI